MKKLFAMMFAFMVASLTTAIYAGTPINQSDLPQAAQEFVKKYFSNEQVKKVEKDNGRRGTEYEVEFVSGAEVEFISDGNWKEVKATPIPAGIVPDAIAKYVTDNFKDQTIKEISRKRGGYEVELTNGTELRLTEDAQQMPARQGKGRPRR